MRKTRISTVLNIIGMSISLMVFLVLFAQVWYDYRFNRNFEDYENIYRFEEAQKHVDDYQYKQTILRPYIEAFKTCSPDIVSACDYADIEGTLNLQVGVNENGEIRMYEIPQATTDTDFPNVFELEIIAGSIEDYDSKNEVLISENYARQIFSGRNPIGESLTLDLLGYEYKVVGVYRDLPENCCVVNGLLVNIGDDDMDLTETNDNAHVGFFRLRKGASVEDVLESFRKVYPTVREVDSVPEIRLTPIADTHFLEDTEAGQKPSAKKTQTLILLSISLLFLLISVFNYVNFAIASIPFRINGINIEKVYGASRRRLIFNQLKVNITICLVSFVLAAGLMEIVSNSQFASFSICSLAVSDNIGAIMACLAVALISATAGGVVTAIYSTSFDPGMVLKGEFAISGNGTSFRRISMVTQFVISCIFLICGLSISRQTTWMMQKDNGFESENIIHMKSVLIYAWHRHFDELLQNPEILEMTCGAMPMNEVNSSRYQMKSKDNEDIWYSMRTAHNNYFDFFDFELVEGRFPVEGENDKAIINETFARTFPEYKVGSKIKGITECEIIGIVKDFNARPLMHDIEPIIYNISNIYGSADLFLKIRSENLTETVRWLEKTLGELFELNGGKVPWETSFLDDDIDNLYRKEVGQTKLITNSSLLCLLIALIGVLGIVYFETQVMRKEIAVRKVNGATTWEVIGKLLVRYLMTSSLGFLIAVPVSILIMRWWLSGFAFSAGMSVWIFILAYLLISVLTAAVVVLRSYSAASANPVEALKKE